MAEAAKTARPKPSPVLKLEGGSRFWKTRKPLLPTPEGGPVRAALYVLQDGPAREANRQMRILLQRAKERGWSVVMKSWERIASPKAPRPRREPIFRAAREGLIDVVMVFDATSWSTWEECSDNDLALRLLLGYGVGFVGIPRVTRTGLYGDMDLTKPSTRTTFDLAVGNTTAQQKRFLRLFGPNEEGAKYATLPPSPEVVELVERLKANSMSIFSRKR